MNSVIHLSASEMEQAMKERHSVRQYEEKPIAPEKLRALEEAIRAVNADSGLHVQLIKNEPKAFSGMMAHYGKFSGVTSYIAMIGKKSDQLEEECGYYGEQLVLLAQSLGLNTCWTALTYAKVKDAYDLKPGEKVCIVIALGTGKTSGKAHTSKSPEDVSSLSGPMPAWFEKGVQAALLAPTAMNQQKFHFTLEGTRVKAEPGRGFYSKIDLGIAKYHFEQGSGKDSSIWI